MKHQSQEISRGEKGPNSLCIGRAVYFAILSRIPKTLVYEKLRGESYRKYLDSL